MKNQETQTNLPPSVESQIEKADGYAFIIRGAVVALLNYTLSVSNISLGDRIKEVLQFTANEDYRN